MNVTYIGFCTESGCDWHHCDFSEKDEKVVLSGAERHHNETGHTVTVESKVITSTAKELLDNNFKNMSEYKTIKVFKRE